MGQPATNEFDETVDASEAQSDEQPTAVVVVVLMIVRMVVTHAYHGGKLHSLKPFTMNDFPFLGSVITCGSYSAIVICKRSAVSPQLSAKTMIWAP